MQAKASKATTRRRPRHDRFKSQPDLPTQSLAESNHYADIPPNRTREEQGKVAYRSPGLECDETMDSYQVPLQIVDVEDDAFIDVSANHPGKASGSFIREIHELEAPVTYVELDIEELEDEEDTSWTLREQPYIYSLLEKETEYACNPFALQLYQPNVSPLMRAILIDWVMEVCSEFTLKRETYYLAVNYIDRFMSAHPGVRKDEFQLLGLSCMFLAAKTEEICNPKIADFARSADNGYSLSQIKAMELKVLRTLSWRVFPPTVYNWASLTMTLWDDFLGCIYSRMGEGGKDQAISPEQQSKLEEYLIQFKQPNQHSYKRFRETMQVLDVAFLDVGVLRYSPRHIVAGLMYLMISKYFYETNYGLFSHPDAHPSPSHKDEEKDSIALFFGDGACSISLEEARQEEQLKNAKIVQDLYSEFTCKAIELRNIEDIYPTVAFLHGFLEFDMVVELPVVCKVLPKAKLESHYEDFLAFQTHNSNNVPFVSQRLKSDKSR